MGCKNIHSVAGLAPEAGSGRAAFEDTYRENLAWAAEQLAPLDLNLMIEPINGKTHPILEASGDTGQLDNTDVYEVPAEHYFAMGDNRDRSQDSRVLQRVGFIHKQYLVGRAEILFFSTNGEARFWEFWKWPVSMRFKRFFQEII